MKRIIMFLLIIICIISSFPVYASEQYSDGWHTVKAIQKTSLCPLNYVWGYYKNGVEVERYCRLLGAHRGWGDAPENSLDAIKNVKKNGYLQYETDVYFTKDNIPVLSHDETINRIARNKDFSKINKDIYIKNSTLSELNKYIFVVSRIGKILYNYPNNKIAKFEDALKYTKESGLFVSIELKDGSASQIASLVNMVKKYKMENNVRWLSFNPILLKYVIDVNKSAELHLLCQADYHTNCDASIETQYCGTDAEKTKYYSMLDTGKNHVIMKNGPSSDAIGQGTILNPNMPESIVSYPMNKNGLAMIQKGKISVGKTKVSVKTGGALTLTYDYNGDGKVKCSSSNTSAVTCSIDAQHSQIVIMGEKTASNVTVNLYAAQGVMFSATPDFKINVSVTGSNTSSNGSSSKSGDVDGNGKVNSVDYITLRKHLLRTTNLTGDSLKRADVNNDGKVNASDYIAIRKKIINN